jgi:lysophospholipase L1-like esterase
VAFLIPLKMYKKRISTLLVFLTLLSLLAFRVQQQQITVYLIGDSTMADKQVKAYPETGWGMPFKWFFDNSVKVDNRALNGRSTKSFIEERHWQPVVDDLKAGDYVFVQFGHNDEVPTKKTYTTEAEFKNYLIRYVSETKAKHAYPVLITPVARRKFNAQGIIEGTHDAYSAIVRQVAAEQHVPLIDLDKESQQMLQKYGPENSTLLYNHLTAGENPNYPDGKTDDTHFNELGARKMAQIVLADVRALKLGLAEHIVNGKNVSTVNPQAK